MPVLAKDGNEERKREREREREILGEMSDTATQGTIERILSLGFLLFYWHYTGKYIPKQQDLNAQLSYFDHLAATSLPPGSTL